MSLISIVNRANPLASITNLVSDTSISNSSTIKSLTSQISQYIYVLTDTVAGPGGFPAANANLKRIDTSARTSSNMSTSLGSTTVDMAVYTSGNNSYFILGGTTSKISQIGDVTSNYNLLNGSSTALSSKYLYVKPSTTTLFYTGTSDSKVSNTTLSVGSSPNFTLTWDSGSQVNSDTGVVKILSSPTSGIIYYIVSAFGGTSPPTFYSGGSDGTGYTQVTGVPFYNNSTSYEVIRDAEFDSSGNIWFTGLVSNGPPPYTYFLKKFVFDSGSSTAGSVTTTSTLTNAVTRGLFIENTTGSGCYTSSSNAHYINPINTY
jgi:hypothetical protein